MTNLEIVLKVIELVEAINNNNLSDTKNIINYFNNNFVPGNGIDNLNNHIPLYELIEKHFNNECYLYMLNNLKNLDNIDKLKWNIKIQHIRASKNKQEIINFIEESIGQNDLLPYQITSLIYLCVKTDRYDFLPYLRINATGV